MYSTPLAVCTVEATRTFAVIGTRLPADHDSRWLGAQIVPWRSAHGRLRSRPPELRTVSPDTVQNDGQLPRDCDLGLLCTNPLAQSLAPFLERETIA
jgi:hypothetical protein